MRSFSNVNDALKGLQNKSGIYVFLSTYLEALYIGRSIYLGKRVKTSLSERLQKKNRIAYVSWALTDTEMDTAIYELLYIGALKPEMNVLEKYSDDLTLDFPALTFRDPVRVLYPKDIRRPCEQRLRTQKEVMLFENKYGSTQVG